MREMQAMDVPITLITMTDYIVPALLTKNTTSADILQGLENNNIKAFNSVNSLVQYHLYNMDVTAAIEICEYNQAVGLY